ncbi:MAG: L-threonine 3-dehydrogenase [Lentisphaerae bacterium ADurb.Bin242]|nr:MAG: L-threonine 3-dehydrogenase [Lentisphaerae bacterium ADurb.Bin242]
MDKINRFITFTGVRKAEMAETPRVDPPDTSRMVFIRTYLSLVSPGTELAFFEGSHTDLKTGARAYPASSGYSAVGTVLETGREVADVKPGDFIVTMCGHCDQGWTNTWERIPDGVTPEQAVFAILGSIALHGVRSSELQIGMKVFVSGLGVIGQMAAALCHTGGADVITGADVYPFRRETAAGYGADLLVSPDDPAYTEKALDATGGKGYDILIVANGVPDSIPAALKLVAPKGRIVILGCPHGNVGIDFYTELQRKEIRILGSYQPCCPDLATPYYPWNKASNRNLILRYQQKKRFDFSKLITHKGRPEDAQRFFDLLSREKNQCITAAFQWENAK